MGSVRAKRILYAPFFLLAALLFCSCNNKPEEVASQRKIPLQDGVKRPKAGDIVPDFVLSDISGKRFKLSDFEGSYVFLNFWATWCPPCIGELPAMEALNGRLRTKPFTMIAVSVDESWDPIHNFLKLLNRSPSFLILLDRDKHVASELYGTKKFPETFVIGPDRRLIKKHIGAVDWMNTKQMDRFEAYFRKNE